ncbi:MAG: hypothetical protein JSV31_22445 [Desulfobacterales bacterium]|nr:MAG: hypothetical protein JSV31_22445 [Desulfobacterales bacterium]
MKENATISDYKKARDQLEEGLSKLIQDFIDEWEVRTVAVMLDNIPDYSKGGKRLASGKVMVAIEI